MFRVLAHVNAMRHAKATIGLLGRPYDRPSCVSMAGFGAAADVGW